MSVLLLYEYAVIRIVPRVEREEFINSGLILYCREARFLDIRYKVDRKKILALNPEADVQTLTELMVGIEKVCLGDKNGGEIAKLTIAERFRWLTAQRSAMIQVSPVHPGLTSDPKEKLNQLYRELIL